MSLDSVDAYDGAPNPPNISVPRTHSIQSKILNYPIWHPVNLHKSWFRVSTPSGKVVIIFFYKMLYLIVFEIVHLIDEALVQGLLLSSEHFDSVPGESQSG